MKKLRLALVAATATFLAALAITMVPATASGHAQLTGTVPERGAALAESPESITLRFNEPVEASFGGVAIFDSSGRQMKSGPVRRPDERPNELEVALEEELKSGAFTVTYRAVSADSHPITGGFVFSVGEGSAPAMTVAELLSREGGANSGPAVDVVFASAKVLIYIALAMILGGLAFAFLVWLPASPPPEANQAFTSTIRRLFGWGGLVLILATFVSLIAQGARAGGTGLFAALDPAVIDEVMGTRFGETAAVRMVAGLVAIVSLSLFRPGRPGGAGRAALALVALAGLAAALSVGLGGHAGSTDPTWLTVAANLIHVLAMAAWFGGLGLLLFVYRRLAHSGPGSGEGNENTPFLAALVARFSTLAIVAVAALLVTGIAQSIVYLEQISELWQTAFGRAILIKVGLLLGLIALGSYNRLGLLPRLKKAARGGQPPGGAGKALRIGLRIEIGLALGVLIASAALSSYSPLASADAVFSDVATAGPIEAELVLEPPRVGPQALHLYLFDGETGRQWTEVKDVSLSAEEPGQGIGPLPIELRNAGPGHYLAGGNLIAVPGEWTLAVDIRASEFDAYKASFEVRVR